MSERCPTCAKPVRLEQASTMSASSFRICPLFCTTHADEGGALEVMVMVVMVVMVCCRDVSSVSSVESEMSISLRRGLRLDWNLSRSAGELHTPIFTLCCLSPLH